MWRTWPLTSEMGSESRKSPTSVCIGLLMGGLFYEICGLAGATSLVPCGGKS